MPKIRLHFLPPYCPSFNAGVQAEAGLEPIGRAPSSRSRWFRSRRRAIVLIDDKYAIAHNKIILIDDDVVITGSFNFSKAAEESNAENLLIIKDHPEVFGRYSASFEAHALHSEPYQGLGK